MNLKGIFSLMFLIFCLEVFSQSDTITIPFVQVELPDVPESLIPKEPERDTIEIFEQSQTDIEPEFPGGKQEFYNFLRENMTYPEEAKKKGQQGKVYVSFIIDENGCLINLKVLKGNYELLNNEAIRVFMLMPDWLPGEHQNKCIKTRCAIPIYFQLKDNQPSKKEIRKSKRK